MKRLREASAIKPKPQPTPRPALPLHFCWSCKRVTEHDLKRNEGWDGSGGSELACVDPKHDAGADHGD